MSQQKGSREPDRTPQQRPSLPSLPSLPPPSPLIGGPPHPHPPGQGMPPPPFHPHHPHHPLHPNLHSLPSQFPLNAFFTGPPHHPHHHGHPPPHPHPPHPHHPGHPHPGHPNLHPHIPLHHPFSPIPPPPPPQHLNTSTTATESTSTPYKPSKSTKTSTPASSSSSKSKNIIPATIPIVQVEEGIEYITFTYSVKGLSKDYKIRTDIETLSVDDIDFEFKQNNCVYPRAYVPRDQYAGNRWDYETTVNTLGWKLAWINQDSLCGKRGLIQRAVDSYRNRFPEMRSRRVVRQEKLIKGTLRKRSERPTDNSNPDTPVLSGKSTPAPQSDVQSLLPPSQHSSTTKDSISSINNNNNSEHTQKINKVTSASASSSQNHHHHSRKQQENTSSKKFKSAKSLTFEMIEHGQVIKTRIRCDIDPVSLQDIHDDFRKTNAVYPRAFVEKHEYKGSRYEHEKEMNEIGWKLAWINTKLHGKKGMLQRALDTWRTKFRDKPRKGKRAVEEVTLNMFTKERSDNEEEDVPEPLRFDPILQFNDHHHHPVLDDDCILSDGMSAAELLHGLVNRST